MFLGSVLFESVIGRKEFSYQQIVPLKELFDRLHQEHVLIGLATADTDTAVRRCFQKLGILSYFDFLGWDDGSMKPKPDLENERYIFLPYKKVTVENVESFMEQ